MNPSSEQRARAIMNGADRSLTAHVLRVSAAILEPPYSILMRLRNKAYDTGFFRRHSLGRPVISVGNLTTGGAGKTPVVQWLAGKLRDRGFFPAVLLRGYKGGPSAISDEQAMLDLSLNSPELKSIHIEADPSRLVSARHALAAAPQTDVFILDDAFQHRKAARNFDLVLINATEPFGFAHVLPRGMLREPLSGVARAHAVLITRADQVTAGQLKEIQSTIHHYAPKIPIYHAAHAHVGLRSTNCLSTGPGDLQLTELRRRRFFAFAGIGNPESLDAQLRQYSPQTYAGQQWFPDHHHYTSRDLSDLQDQAQAAGAEMLLTTEKDWTKLAGLPLAGLPVFRLELALRFWDQDEEALLDQIIGSLPGWSAKRPAATVTDIETRPPPKMR